MPATVGIPTLPGLTDAQVVEAIAIVSAVYSREGVQARVEPHIYRDPEIPGSEVVEIRAWLGPGVSREVLRKAIRSVPAALRARGLYDPDLPLTTHPFASW